MKEIWKEIKGYPNYMVSNMGRVKSLGNNKTRKEKILNLYKRTGGYLYVSLSKNGKLKNYRVHRLVYETFLGEIPDGMQCNHINEDKTDNRLENLNLMTPKENCNWATRIKRIVKATSKQVLQIDKNTNEIIKEFPSTKEVQRQLGYLQAHICQCCKGKQKTSYGFIWKYKENGDNQ